MRRLKFLIVAVALTLAACDDDDTPISPVVPTDPVTETFSETLNPNGGVTYSFANSRSGSVTVSLTSLAPDSTAIVGLSLGTWNGSACAVVISNDQATQGTVLVGAITSSGNLCARVYDVGRLTANVSFTITVVHP
jgi:hypothetical protein